VLRYPAPTIEQMRKYLFSYRDNMRVEVEQGISVTAKTVADLRALSTWPEGLVLNIHVDLAPPIERRNGGAGILIQHARPPLPAALVCRCSSGISLVWLRGNAREDYAL
jgi:hypothetical protein